MAALRARRARGAEVALERGAERQPGEAADLERMTKGPGSKAGSLATRLVQGRARRLVSAAQGQPTLFRPRLWSGLITICQSARSPRHLEGGRLLRAAAK